jgi:hypothetical protein
MIFGTFDYMRAELEVVHSAEQFWVNSHDNSKIDCMIIPSAVNRTIDEQSSSFLNAGSSNRGPQHTSSAHLANMSEINSNRTRNFESSDQQQQNPFPKLSIDNKSTNFVLFCNPNAVFYEFMNY